MKMDYLKSEVKENVEICNGIYSLKVIHDTIVKPGQFYMLKPKTAFLGRPISVCEVNGNEITFVYAVVGKGTEEFKTLRNGDIIEITDTSGNTLRYSVYNKYEVIPEDLSCTSQLTNGRKEITLITCTNDSKMRVIVKARVV